MGAGAGAGAIEASNVGAMGGASGCILPLLLETDSRDDELRVWQVGEAEWMLESSVSKRQR